MYDKALIVDILKDILSSMEHVLRRFQVIRSSEDFVKDDIGREKLVPLLKRNLVICIRAFSERQ